MRWRSRGWSERIPRPKAAGLPREALQGLHARAAQFVEASRILREPDDIMARITPLGPRSMLLKYPRGNSWVEHKRGQLRTVLKLTQSSPAPPSPSLPPRSGSINGTGRTGADARR